MRLTVTVADPTAANADVDVFVDADDESTVRSLRECLERVVGRTADGLWVDGARLDDDAPLGSTPLRAGCVVSLVAPGASSLPPIRGWLLTVVSGPDAGTVMALPLGTHEIGRSPGLPFTDPAMSRLHARLSVSHDGATLTDLGSANGTTVDGQPIPAAGRHDPSGAAVALGQLIGMGDNLLTIVAAPPADAPVHTGPAGTVEFSRPPRLLPSDRAQRIALPTAPGDRARRKIPVAATLAPLALGIVMAVVIGQPIYLLFALATPLIAVSNVVSDRRQSAKDHRQAVESYTAAMAETTERLASALREETATRRVTSADPAATFLTATLPGRRLWERRRHDADALALRVGTADLPSRIAVEATRPGTAADAGTRTVFAVPVLVPLRDVGVLGLAGPVAVVAGLARWLVVQLAIHHAPRDVGLTILAPRSRCGWQWARWLPHLEPLDPDNGVVSLATDPVTLTARIGELVALLKVRRDAVKAAGRLDRSVFPARVVVLDGARALRATPGLPLLLTDGPDHGIHFICLDDEERFLPEECAATVVVRSDDPARLDLSRSGADPLPGVLAEPVSVAYADAVARAVAAIRDVSTDEDEATLPGDARLLDILGLEPPTADAVRARWQLESRTTAIPVGLGLDGVFTLDLRRDGPHGLIAGTTGSGKSELLQSVIASLAVGNRPEAMNFVLVDYKGGSAFKDCVALPHTVGMVTDLDAHLVERALTSLSAELRRREHQLADAAVKDLDDYDAARLRDLSLPPLPRLVLVIDEFASMVRELPEFVSGLVNIAQRGRSLGLHLLLATQRPSGVVSPEIRANANLRISLRVTDNADSTDVLDAPDAARIAKSTPGRAYARLGHGALLPFQAGRVGGRRPGLHSSEAPAPYAVAVGWRQLGYPPPQAPAVRIDRTDATDLSVLVDAVRAAAEIEGVVPSRRPWLPPLPERLLLDALVEQDAAADGDVAPLVYGLADLPAQQHQQVAAFDLVDDGHLLAVGGTRSGRSQLLRTLAGGVAMAQCVADVHLYALDCGNGALLPMTALPHCGAVVTRTQPERAARLIGRMLAEVDRRHAVLATAGFADISEQRRSVDPADRLPHLVLLLDRWEGFVSGLGEVDNGRLADAVLTLLREGASAGVHVVITGDRSLAAGRIGSLTDNKLAFRLADRADYSLMGLNPRQLPDEIPPGRCFATRTATEVQVALLGEDDSGQAQATALTTLGARAGQRDSTVPARLRPFRVDELPAHVSLEQAWALRPATAGRLAVTVGVGGDELTALGPDLSTTAAFVVAGPAKSGRSNLLLVMARSLLRTGVPIVIGAPRPSPLRDLAGYPGVVGVVTDPAATLEDWRQMLSGGGPLVVVLDDAEGLKDSAAGELFRSVVKGSVAERALVLGGHAEGICTGLSGWQVDAKKARCGALLSPQSSADGDLIGVRLARSTTGGPVTPGRALLHLGDGRAVTVAVPHPALSMPSSAR
jgi:S-DNA-T family DNA segregation ATPase FtsK/SpoIIIE